MTQVNVAEDFEELLIDKIPDLPQQFLRFVRSLLEKCFYRICKFYQSFSSHYIVQSIQ